MSWEVRNSKGIWLPKIGWWLDATQPVERSFVSHAHFDHMSRHRELICSPGTQKLMRARLGKGKIRPTEHVLPFGSPEALTEEVSITLLPAGHVLGSAQCLLEHPQWGRLLYTGDFKLRQGLAAEPCAVPRAEVLIMESTFGKPQYLFPSHEKVMGSIADFCERALGDSEIPVLLAYSLGKAQELLKGIGGRGFSVMLHSEAARITRVYEELGQQFPPYRELVPDEAAGHVVILSPQAHRPSSWAGQRLRTATATGWALDARTKYQSRTDAAFPLSDHAGFDDLLHFVDRVAPKRVFTVHGFAVELARDLRSRGFDASALAGSNQLDLAL